MDLGFITHGNHANTRQVFLKIRQSRGRNGSVTTLTVSNPSNCTVYPPGPGWIFVVVDGIPSKGAEVMVGDGTGPPVDEAALEKLVFTSCLTCADSLQYAVADES